MDDNLRQDEALSEHEKKWRAAAQHRKAHERRTNHSVLFTLGFFLLTVILMTILDINNGTEMQSLFLTFITIAASYGFWNWFMKSPLIDRKYGDYPKNRKSPKDNQG